MGARLLYRDLHGADKSVDLPESGGALGRSAECLVRTQDVVVARRNCMVKPHEGRWYVEDLGSPNGTFLNEQRVQREKLSHGDVIRCGSLQVRFIEVVPAVTTPRVVVAARADASETRTDIAPRYEDVTLAQIALDAASVTADLVQERDRALTKLAAAEQHVAELRTALSEAYYGVNDSLADLRLAAVVTREAYSKLEPGMQDKAVAKEMLEAIDRTLDLARETRNHVRSLRNLIEPRSEKGSDRS